MNCRLSALAVGILATCVSVGRSADFKFAGQTLTVPDGFEVELIAGPPSTLRPIVADFDEEGRLYVADSSGSNDKVEKQLEEKPHRILRLEDTDGDGRFDRQTVFADRMMFPEGILFFHGAVYSSAPPSIWKLVDTDNDGVADERTEWFKGKTLTGCANDLHGPYLGPDGWIYWAKGAFAKQTYERPGRPTISDSAAHIFRSRPDGSHFDSLMSGGMDNPVDVVFTPEGDSIFTTTFYVNPEGGRRDALVHAVYGGVYPKVHGVIDGLKRTGDLMPALTHLGPAAPCGLVRYNSQGFGAEYEGNLFSCQFNLHKVQRHVLQPAGGSYRTVDSDFLVSDHPDFHPTDVLEDADGSLIVIDTGGWYKLCCPTSVIARPEVLGAIYRIRRSGAAPIPDPRGRKLKWETLSAPELVELLNDSRPAVRERAIQQLARQGAPSIDALQMGKTPAKPSRQRLNAVWALTRLDDAAARMAVRQALADENITVRRAAVHSVGIWRDRAAVSALIPLLESSDLQLRRQVATALGQIGDAGAVGRILAAAANVDDRFLEHALIYALIELNDPAATRAGLKAGNSQARRAALIALDQMSADALSARDVIPLLRSDDAVLQATALWIAGHRPSWASESVGYYTEQIERPSLDEKTRTLLREQLTALARHEAIQKLVGTRLLAETTPVSGRLLLLDVMSRVAVKPIPSLWKDALIASLTNTEVTISRRAIATARTIAGAKNDFVPSLTSLAHDASRPTALRLEALSALPGAVEKPPAELFGFLCQAMKPDRPVMERAMAANILGKAILSDDQLMALTDLFAHAGALEVSALLSSFEKAKDEQVGLKLVSALEKAPSLSRVRPDVVRARLMQFPASVQERGQDLLTRLNPAGTAAKAQLEKFAAIPTQGDSRNGQMIFNSARAACATCHAVGYVGGRVGPDLTKIGPTRTERDLLESIIFPSATFVRSYESVVVAMRDGEEHSGMLRDESERNILLMSAPGAEQRLERSDILEIRPGTVSIMPEGLDEQLSRQELADLVAFLKSLR